MRRGVTGDRTASTQGVAGGGMVSGSSGCSAHMASNISARSGTLRAIGPSTHNGSNGSAVALRGTRPRLGLRHKTPQKLAG